MPSGGLSNNIQAYIISQFNSIGTNRNLLKKEKDESKREEQVNLIIGHFINIVKKISFNSNYVETNKTTNPPIFTVYKEAKDVLVSSFV